MLVLTTPEVVCGQKRQVIFTARRAFVQGKKSNKQKKKQPHLKSCLEKAHTLKEKRKTHEERNQEEPSFQKK